MNIIVNGKPVTLDSYFRAQSYSEICRMADVLEKRNPNINCAFLDGRSLSVVAGQSILLGPGTVINVAVTGGA